MTEGQVNGRVPQPISGGLSLLYLLVYSFGWTKPYRGLKWWLDAGRPTQDLRLDLIEQTWATDGQLNWLLAWLGTPYTCNHGSWGNATKLGPEVDLHARHHRRSQGHEMILEDLNLVALGLGARSRSSVVTQQTALKEAPLIDGG